MLFKKKTPSSYQEQGLNRTFFTENIQYVSRSEQIFYPGFFTPFSSVGEFAGQLRAPFAMALLCLTAAVKIAVDVIEDIAINALHLVILDFEVGDNFRSAYDGMSDIVSYVITGVVDALRELAALVSRTLATVVSLGVDAVDFAQDIFSSNAGEKSQSKNLSFEESTGFSDSNPCGEMQS